MNQRNPKLFDRTVLMIGIMQRYKDITLALIKHPSIDVSLSDSDGHTQLSIAAGMGSSGVSKQLLQFEDININHQDSFGRSALLSAVMDNRYEVVKILLEYGANTDLTDLGGYNVMLRAVELGNFRIFEYLLGSGVDIGCKNEYNRELLHVASENGHPEIIQTLLDEQQIDLNSLDCLGMSALHRSCMSRRLSIYVEKMKNSVSHTSFHSDYSFTYEVSIQSGMR